MDHIAIMRKSWGLTKKILSGEKTIESRWYKNKAVPWNRIHSDDTVYFKDSGEPISLKAQVWKVLQFENLTNKKVHEILGKYGEADGIGGSNIKKFYQLFKTKNYCILIFLKGVQSVEPFNIDKSGFGAMTAWVTVENVKQIEKG